ncbi:MAG: hypothetical protein JXR73_06325 [Candidatus Omnitrophica bacterium]|nr:hypothetical protein [Candidatus Omnitrophota bacterium]
MKIAQKIFVGLFVACMSIVLVPQVYSQPFGEEITVLNDTPTFDVAGLEVITADGPVVLGQTINEDREPKISILNNGSTSVFWVNRGGSHHVNGVDASGNIIFPTITDDAGIDVIVDVNTGSNTNWTLDKADRVQGGFLVAATWQFGTLTGSSAVVPSTVIDDWGIREDDGQGHGFFKLFDDQFQATTPDPISISQFSAGHREWDCCWLSDGKFVIATVARGHPYAADPDFPDGGQDIGLINIFNSDGTRFKDEFFVSDDLTGQQNDMRLGALANGFVCIYMDNKSSAGGASSNKGVIFDNDGNKVKDFVATDEATGINVNWMDAGGGNTFVTVHNVSGPADVGLPDSMVGQAMILARVWNDQGEPITPFIAVTQHDDRRSVSRERCAMAANGSFVITWHDGLADLIDMTQSVVARVFKVDGTPVTDAFVAHPLPEFLDPDTGESSGGGDPGEAIPAITNDRLSIAWGSRAVPGKGYGTRDAVVMSFTNPAEDTASESWSLY